MKLEVSDIHPSLCRIGRVDPALLPLELPQLSEIKRNVRVCANPEQEWDLAGQRRVIQEKVVHTAMSVCGMRETGQCKVYELDRGDSALAQARNTIGFVICDGRAEDAGNKRSIEIATVILARSPGRHGVVVPLVIPHEHPRQWGEAVRDAIYREYFNEYGKTPPEMARSRLAEFVRDAMTWINAHRRDAATGAAGMLALVGGLCARPALINNIAASCGEKLAATALADVEEEKREKVAALAAEKEEAGKFGENIAEVKTVAAAYKKGELRAESLLKAVNGEHFRAIERQLADQNAPLSARLEAIETLKTLAGAQQQAKQDIVIKRGWSMKIANQSYYQDEFKKLAETSNDVEIRHAAADALNTMRTLWPDDGQNVCVQANKLAGKPEKLQKWRADIGDAYRELETMCREYRPGGLSATSVMNMLDAKHFEALLYKLECKAESPLPFSLLRQIAQVQFETGMTPVLSYERLNQEYFRKELVSTMEHATSPIQRHAAADTLHDLHRLWNRMPRLTFDSAEDMTAGAVTTEGKDITPVEQSRLHTPFEAEAVNSTECSAPAAFQ